MTTHRFSGIRITTNGSGTPTAVTSSTMNWAASEFFRFKYTLDTPTNGDFSSITVALASPSKLLQSSVSVQGGTARVNLDTTASIGQYSWGAGNQTTVMIVRTSATEFSLFALAGDALPAITNLSTYNSFLASVTGLTSVLSTGLGTFGHSTLHNMTRALSYSVSVEGDLINGVTGVDNWTTVPLATGMGNDTVHGTGNADWVLGGDNSDQLFGYDGDDRLYGELGNDQLFGGAGNDSLYGGNNFDYIEGGTGNDSIVGGQGDDTLLGEDGADRMFGDSGNDQLYGGLGVDTIQGGDGNDVICGGDDNDVLRGDRGADQIYGGNGHDNIQGGGHADTIHGDDGNDTIDGGTDNDLIYGGVGNDSIIGGAGNDQAYGGVGNDTVLGNAGDDTLFGDDGDDLIDGGAGNDLIDGGNGADMLRGGVGDDVILSGLGDDTMFGYNGADHFVIEAVTGHDTITDFRGDFGDRLFISDELAADVATAMGFATQVGTAVVFDFGEAGSVTVNRTTLALAEQYLEIWTDPSDYM